MTVSFEPGRIATITLRRPERRNALDSAMLASLLAHLADVASDDGTRCVLLRGEGDAFCAGADFGDVAGSAAEGARYGGAFEELLVAIERLPVPVVARVQGPALGAGCQILTACDLSVAAEDATVGVPSARLGILLDLEKIERMVRVLGLPTTREMLLAGRNWSGAEAAERGLVTKAVPADRLDEETTAMCEQVASCAPLSVRGTKAGLHAIVERGSLDRTRDADVFAGHDARALAALQSADLAEGLAALKERRRPQFHGR